MMAGMKFGILCLSAVGLLYGMVILIVEACWRTTWLAPVLLCGTVIGFIILACGVMGKALGF